MSQVEESSQKNQQLSNGELLALEAKLASLGRDWRVSLPSGEKVQLGQVHGSPRERALGGRGRHCFHRSRGPSLRSRASGNVGSDESSDISVLSGM